MNVALMLDTAFDLLAAIDRVGVQHGHNLTLRIGVHTGTVYGSIFGKLKFTYDLHGEAIDVVAMLEQDGEPSKIHVSDQVCYVVYVIINCDSVV